MDYEGINTRLSMIIVFKQQFEPKRKDQIIRKYIVKEGKKSKAKKREKEQRVKNRGSIKGPKNEKKTKIGTSIVYIKH